MENNTGDLPTFLSDDPQVEHLKQSTCRFFSLILTNTPLKFERIQFSNRSDLISDPTVGLTQLISHTRSKCSVQEAAVSYCSRMVCCWPGGRGRDVSRGQLLCAG